MSSPTSDDEFTQEDADFHQQLLEKLADFGDSLLDEEDFAERKRKAAKRKSRSSKHVGSVQSCCSDAGSERKHHQQKKTMTLLSECAETKLSSGKSNSLQGELKYLQQLQTELGLATNGSKKLQKGKLPEQLSRPTAAQHNKCDKKPIKEPSVIVFREPCRNKKKKLEPQNETELPEDPAGQPEMTLKHARFDVRKLGIKGMAEADKEGATVAMLMQLGAKAPKKKYVNYRLLLESKKKAVAEEKLKSETDHTLGYKMSAATKKKKRTSGKKERNAIGYLDGQIGQYKGGVQHVNPSDLGTSTDKKRRKRRK